MKYGKGQAVGVCLDILFWILPSVSPQQPRTHRYFSNIIKSLVLFSNQVGVPAARGPGETPQGDGLLPGLFRLRPGRDTGRGEARPPGSPSRQTHQEAEVASQAGWLRSTAAPATGRGGDVSQCPSSGRELKETRRAENGEDGGVHPAGVPEGCVLTRQPSTVWVAQTGAGSAGLGGRGPCAHTRRARDSHPAHRCPGESQEPGQRGKETVLQGRCRLQRPRAWFHRHVPFPWTGPDAVPSGRPTLCPPAASRHTARAPGARGGGLHAPSGSPRGRPGRA